MEKCTHDDHLDVSSQIERYAHSAKDWLDQRRPSSNVSDGEDVAQETHVRLEEQLGPEYREKLGQMPADERHNAILKASSVGADRAWRKGKPFFHRTARGRVEKADDAPSPDEQVMNDDLVQKLLRAIHCLPEDGQAVIKVFRIRERKDISSIDKALDEFHRITEKRLAKSTYYHRLPKVVRHLAHVMKEESSND